MTTHDDAAAARDSVSIELAAWMAHLPGVDPGVEAVRQRIRRLARLFDQVLAAAAAEHDLTVGDWEALSVLQRAGPPHAGLPTQLALALGITSGTMSLRIDRLTRAGLVEPAPGEDVDGRSRPIRLTTQGRERWRAATDDRTRHEHRLLADTLHADELARLNDLLAVLLTRFETEFGRVPASAPLSAGSTPARRRSGTADPTA